MSRLVIVSNRLPVTVVRKEGKFQLEPSAGGLATGLGSVSRAKDSLWVGWCGMARERVKGHEAEIDAMLKAEKCKKVMLTRHDVEYYYHGFSNKTIWPLFHYFPIYTIYSKHFWEAYKRVNKEFCDAVIEVLQDGDIIWIHDYQLMLLPKMLRDRLPDATIGFFLHIPFVSSEVFRLLPWRREILDGILGADLVGFHTYDYVRHFVESVRRVSGYEHNFGYMSVGSRTIRADAFPMGIDYRLYSTAGERPDVQNQCRRIRKQIGDRKMILGIDRLDYTKGIPERLEVFDLFLEKNPEYRGKVTMVMVAVPSRTRLEHYRMLKRRVDELVGRINGKYGSMDWIPVWYLYRAVPFDKLVALYKLSDVALVTPLRDGMNLIAKEFVTSKTDGKGVLILSEMAGAAKELGEALIVNPNNQEEIVAAMGEALSMPENEQIERNRVMQHRLARYSIGGWVGDFMAQLESVKRLQVERGISKLTPEIAQQIVKAYKAAKKRLILLDYDGTLVPFSGWPRKARPDSEIASLLARLARHRKNEVVMVSGRDRKTLDEWFGPLGVGLVAEHGVWVREPADKWEAVETLKDDWKIQVRPLLEIYVDRTPGSFIEEKSFSLAWHYRKADPGWGSLRARELRDDLENLVANLNIGVLEGAKVIEVKDLSINKGRASLRWLNKADWGFILAIGDDWTDEDMFEAMPDTAYSIRVGLTTTRARYNVDSYKDARELLAKLKG